MKIKLTAKIMIGGAMRQEDEILEVNKALAHDLIHRKKAVELKEELPVITEVAKKEEKEPENPYEALKNHELRAECEKRNIEHKHLKKNQDLINLLIKADENQSEKSNELEDEISLDELKKMADELEIEYAENIDAKDLQAKIEEFIKENE